MKTVFLAMPMYSQNSPTIGTCNAIITSTTSKHRVQYGIVALSSLPFCFNTLWCAALNEVPRPDYFVMLHSDIDPTVDATPGYCWLDALIDELEKNQLDVVSSVVRIKNQTGETSTAIMFDKGAYTRLQFRDCADALPATFKMEDITYPPETGVAPKQLLVNTGCMAVRFGQNELWETFAFKFKDWIEAPRMLDPTDNFYKPAERRFIARMFPEDWDFSQFCNSHNLRVGATTAVKVRHLGEYNY